MKHVLIAATAALALGTAAHATELSIATGGTGGVYYPYGGGLAEVIGKHVDGYTASVEVTGASVENMALIQRGDSDLALALADTVYQAYTGTGKFDGKAIPEARALASIYPNAVQIVTLADSGITSLEDLRGKRVSVGAPGSGTELSAQIILASNGITYEDFDPQRLNFNETADAIRDGDIVAGFWSVGPPTSSIMNLAATREISIVALSADEIHAVWHGFERDKFTQAAIRLLLCTGQRVEEVLHATWDEFDTEAKLWTIPAGRRKTKHKSDTDHVVPLFNFAM